MADDLASRLASLESQIHDLKSQLPRAAPVVVTSPGGSSTAVVRTNAGDDAALAAAAAATNAAINAVAQAARRTGGVGAANSASPPGSSSSSSINAIGGSGALPPPAIVIPNSSGGSPSIVLPPTATSQPASTFTDRSKKRCVVSSCTNTAVKRGYCMLHSNFAVVTPSGSGSTPTGKDEGKPRDFTASSVASPGGVGATGGPLQTPGSSGSHRSASRERGGASGSGSSGHRHHHHSHHHHRDTKPPLSIAMSLDSIAKYHFQRTDLATLVNQNLTRPEFFTAVRLFLRDSYIKRGVTLGDDILTELATSLADLYSSLSQYRSLLAVTSSFNRDITLADAIGNIVAQLSVVLNAERVALFFVDHNERRLHTVYDSDTPLSARGGGHGTIGTGTGTGGAGTGTGGTGNRGRAPSVSAPSGAAALSGTGSSARNLTADQKSAANAAPVETSFSMDEGVLGYVARTGQTVNVKDAALPLVLPNPQQYHTPREGSAASLVPGSASGTATPPVNPGTGSGVIINIQKLDERTGRVTRSLLAVPIEDPRTGTVIAVLQAVNKYDPTAPVTAVVPPAAPGSSAAAIAAAASAAAAAAAASVVSASGFTDSDQAVLNFVAVFAGQTIQNAKLYDEAVKRRKAQETLLHMFELISADVSSVGGVEHVLHAIIDTAYQLVEVDRISLFVVDDVATAAANAAAAAAAKANASAAAAGSSTTVAAAGTTTSSTTPVAAGDVLVCRVSKDLSVRGLRVPVGTGSVVGFAAATGQVVNITDAATHRDDRYTVDPRIDRLGPAPAPTQAPGAPAASFAAPAVPVGPPRVTRNVLTLPIMDSSDQQAASSFGGSSVVPRAAAAGAPRRSSKTPAPKAIAVIQVINKREGSFTAEDEALLSSLARGAGVLLRKAQVHEQLVYTQRRTQALLTVLKASERDNDVEGVIDTILQVAYDILQAERMALFFVDHVRKDLYCVRSPDAQGFSLPLTNGIAGWVATNGVGVNCTDVYADPRFDPSFDKITGNRTKSLLCLPIKDATGKTVAVLQAVNKIVSRSDWELINPAAAATAPSAATPEENKAAAPLPAYFSASTGTSSAHRRSLSQANGAGTGSALLKPEDLKAAAALAASTPAPVPAAATAAPGPEVAGVAPPPGTVTPVRRDSTKTPGSASSSSSSANANTAARRSLAERRKWRSTADVGMGGAFLRGVTEMRRPRQHDSNSIVGAPFSAGDEELMAGFCIEIGGTLRRFMTAVLLERSSIGEDLRLNSLLENYGHHDVNIVASIDIAIRKDKPAPKPQTNAGAPGAAAAQVPGAAATAASGSTAGATKSSKPEVKSTPPETPDATRSGSGSVSALTTDGTGSGGGGGPDSPPLTPRGGQIVSNMAWPVAIAVSPGFGFGEMIGSLARLDFDVWAYSEDQLMVCCYYMFQDFDFLNRFTIEPEVMHNFLMSIRYRYRKVPYHNFYHGFSVMQYSYIVLKTTNARHSLEEVDAFGLLVGSLAHDVDHPGNNNVFEINTNSRLALKYNDISVLENHHAFTLFQILSQPNCNVIATLSPDAGRSIRRRMIKGILATDMAGHFELCKRIDQLLAAKINVAQPPTPNPTAPAPAPAAGAVAAANAPNIHFDPKSDSDKQFLFDIVIHSADLQSIVVPVSIAKEWGRRVVAEFNAQAQEEERRGMAVAEFMRGLDQPQNVGKSQRGFVDFVCAPLFAKLVQMFPPLQGCLVNLAGVRAYYDGLANIPVTTTPAKPADTATAAAGTAPTKK